MFKDNNKPLKFLTFLTKYKIQVYGQILERIENCVDTRKLLLGILQKMQAHNVSCHTAITVVNT